MQSLNPAPVRNSAIEVARPTGRPSILRVGDSVTYIGIIRKQIYGNGKIITTRHKRSIPLYVVRFESGHCLEFTEQELCIA